MIDTVSLRGVPVAVHPPGDYLSDVLRVTRDFYEPAILDALRGLVHGGTVIDAGAMLGNHSAYFAAFGMADVIHAFEPVPANLVLLRRNVAPYPQVVVHPVALSDHVGRLRMTAESDNMGHARVEDGTLEVDAVTLDSFAFGDVTLLKVDVEGHEPQVLVGARETIARCQPLVLIEDWPGTGAELLPGYTCIRDWATAHQTYLYAPR